ncbi:hypothetical protein Syun_001882 [Stephania yunnanensis]|uniref:Response regulatory domain-containing protein n=1 Tax=Stephania yunnanensis TaxID=152371 RepID=A0AAP0LGJ9_9MAGN
MGIAAEAQFHVLAVDDSVIDRKMIERLLKVSSFQVTTVDSGSKALEFLGLMGDVHGNPTIQSSSVSSHVHHHQEVEVNLIITDYCMPGMTGYDLLKKIKESSSLKDIPVVIMSSENVPSRINRCLEDGAEEFFLKPVRLSDVNRLKPHLLKSKFKAQQQQLPQQEELEQKEPDQPQQKQQQQQEKEEEEMESIEQKVDEQEQAVQSSVKRKIVEESLSPERTRPRYSGLTMAT